uniref:NADH dehydrogenase subunit 5 n=1 Tax=Euphausia crystallorophias TaxID=48141 RepID=UPI0028FCCCD8|nr:NADH dehydrogenase subunit 5 [Euphausia crystallorophias]WNI01995.1 NADH dehydrogenase subunit 5 [Euphausia crystallorophias]
MLWLIMFHLSSMIFLALFSCVCMLSSIFMINVDMSYFIEWHIVSINSCSIVMTLILDWMSLMFMSFVSFISSMVLFYSGGYMAGDFNINRFIYLVLAFVLSMTFLIISPNMVSILLGWDGLGLVSYVLVIYYQNEKSANAGMLTALSNRIGDVAILLAISLLASRGGWNFYFYTELFNNMEGYGIVGALVVLAAMTKSAQIPFSAWLPAAMAAPTPVSALVHSSTLVTAGVYLLVRFSAAIEGSMTQSVLLLLSSLTMFMAGLGANFEYDLKKIIALSTLSQLGVMMSILSLGYANLAFFHLLSHALFKALLFMCAGAVIHNMKDYQDIRVMGSLVVQMPLTTFCMNLANLALCGSPFLAGFYSKDLILEIAFMSPINITIFMLYCLATGLTVCYTARLIYYTLSGDFNLHSLYTITDESYLMTTPMLFLGGGAIFGGALLSWVIFPAPSMICMPLFFKTLALSVSVLGGAIGYILNFMIVNYKLSSLNNYNYVSFMGSMWFMPFLSTYPTSYSTLKVGSYYMKVADFGWSEYYGGQGIYKTVMKASDYLQIAQDNSFKVYMLSFVMWVLGVLLLL